jgi:hypothetical protein
VTRHNSCRVSPFGHPRINARLTAPRGISQPPTSFIGSQCQGIHHAPLNTYNTKNHYREKLHHNKPHTTCPPKRVNKKPCGLMLATTIHKSNTTPHHQVERQHPPRQRRDDPNTCGSPPSPVSPRTGRREGRPVASKPNSVSDDPPTPSRPNGPTPARVVESVAHQNRVHYRHRPIQRIAQVTEPPHAVGGP